MSSNLYTENLFLRSIGVPEKILTDLLTMIIVNTVKITPENTETNNISKTYFWVNVNLNWNSAQNYCHVNYKDLVSIRNEAENQEIMKNAKSFPFWIGLFNNPWKWSDGGNSTFQIWRNSQPDNWYKIEKCVEYRTSAWNDAACSQQIPFFCYNKSCTSLSCTSTNIFVLNSLSWDDAQNYCRVHYTDLVTVEDQTMNDQLLTMTSNQYFWIGLHLERDNWQWSNGEPLAYTNWEREYFCAVLQSDGSWNDTVCSEEKPFMCYKETSNISERYSWINVNMTWNKAQQYCRVNYTDLVSIRNERENMEIMKKAQGSPFWIGLFNDPWKWSDGAQSKFEKWNNQEPNNLNLNEKCVEIWPNGTWNDADCSLQKPFICSQKTNNISGRYFWINENITWSSAQNYCRVNYTDLVSIRNESENEKIMKEAQGSPFWIGMFNDGWTWSDGGNSAFRNWASYWNVYSEDWTTKTYPYRYVGKNLSLEKA
ncbi:macrophage mannose receptor 1-like [Polypterus senegalus]|uniref:macrophage mannose receptor 1-like n=1 Tax=Polypterus senegalus TaxID=55291 RepID=UPI001964295B|nr:macrophage mannose receptor 1-like [Polypterus senegalus]